MIRDPDVYGIFFFDNLPEASIPRGEIIALFFLTTKINDYFR
jgi:hypothetical protein